MNWAASILAGDLDLGLIVGAEALATVRQLKKAGERPQWSYKPDERRPFPLDVPFHPSEITHAIYEAFLTFALFDNARRAHLGTSLADHQRALGELLSPLTEVAASSPHAWFPIARTPSEISEPRPDNRMVSFPYTKLMTAIMDVDMAAAVVVASSAKADELGVPADQRIYLRGWGYAQDPNHVAAHPDLWRSPAMAAASKAALGGAGIGIDDVAHMDLYSCFASSVAFALDALGLDTKEFSAPSTGRSVTVTGGLPYHGGPGSNYMTHSLAAMTERLRSDPGSFGLVSGVGMHMVKHAYGLWSTTPGSIVTPDPLEVQRQAESASVPSILEGDRRQCVVGHLLSPARPRRFAQFGRGRLRCDGSEPLLRPVCARRRRGVCLAEHEEVIGRTVKLRLADDGSTLASF